MPIYAYKCSTCQHEQDVLQKLSDAPLSICPECGAPTFTKQLTAAGFQLKGSGWYATDFKNGPAKPDTKPAANTGEAGAAGGSDSTGDSGSAPPAPLKDGAPAKDATAPAAPASPAGGPGGPPSAT